MINKDDDNKDIWKKLYSGSPERYSTKRAEENLQQITDMQQEYFEAIVEDSEYIDAIEVISHIRGLK